MNAMSVDNMGIASMAFSLALTLIGLGVWFFLNRASVRANQQIALLTELLEQQKKQTALLKALQPKATPEVNDLDVPLAGAEPIMFKDFIAER